MFTNNLTAVGNVLVRNEIINTRFFCDLNKCKGACCTIYSEYGAPLLDVEIPIIENILDSVFEYLDEANIDEIKSNGFYERKSGKLFIKSIQSRECVFSYFENNIAKCAIEKVYLLKNIEFRKPISCHLFPIRISKFGGDILKYEKFDVCESALENGKNLDITIAEFCKESLIRFYGENWYMQLKEKINK